MKLFSVVNVAAPDRFPIIRLQFSDPEYLKEPASFIDIAIPTATAAEMAKLIQDAIAKQKSAMEAADEDAGKLVLRDYRPN